jgi:prophage tail gpP-like protein
VTIDKDEVTLITGGKIWSGWTEVTVSYAMEMAAGAFEFITTERWPGQQAVKGIQPGADCTVKIGDTIVITGHVDSVEPEYDSGRHQVTIKGRDAAGDLVDCAAVSNSGQWNSAAPLDIAKAICGPFKVPVSTKLDLGAPPQYFRLQFGETAWEAIERLARYLGVIAYSTGLGTLEFVQSGSGGTAAAVKLGDNILAARANYDFKGRFSEVMVIGQSGGSDITSPSLCAGQIATAKDPNVTRYRPKVVMAEMVTEGGNLQQRANWEVAVRAGRSRRAEVTVQGWRDADGNLYSTNTLIHIDDAFLGLKGVYLVAGADFTVSEGGRITKLTLMPPQAFNPMPVPMGGFRDGTFGGGIRVVGN